MLPMSRDFATKSGNPVRPAVRRSGKRAAKSTARTRGSSDARLRGDPASPQFEIDSSPFYLIARTAGRYAIDMENALRVLDLDLASWRALMLVHTVNPSSVSEITERAVMRLSTMTRVVQRLEKRGLVRVDTRKGDGRVTEVFITAAGEEMVKKIRAIASRIYNIAFHDLTAAEIATLNDLLARVFRNLAIQPHP
jgi:MarR family transcriptional regulator, organic hydroperoxide resistance regulator